MAGQLDVPLQPAQFLAVGTLTQSAFDRSLAPCASCGNATFHLATYLDRSLVVMAAEPNDSGKWAHDGEKFIDGTYRISCEACGHVAFSDDQCPRCHSSGGLARALATSSRVAVPKRCGCGELELLVLAMVPAQTRYTLGQTPKPVPSAEFGDSGYHVVAYACNSCEKAVVAEGCPLCGAAGPLRKRP